MGQRLSRFLDCSFGTRENEAGKVCRADRQTGHGGELEGIGLTRLSRMRNGWALATFVQMMEELVMRT